MEISTDVHEEIGQTAGAIWRVLDNKGETTLAALKKETDAPSPIFDWAIGWLAREGQIAITRDKRSILVRLAHHPPKVVKTAKAASA